MSRVEESAYQGQLVLIMGVLGSVMIAALVLVLQAPERFQITFLYDFLGLGRAVVSGSSYFQLLITLLTFTSFLSIIGSVASAEVSATKGKPNNALAKFAEGCVVAALACFGISLALLILPSVILINEYLFNFILLSEGVLLVTLGTLSRRNTKRPTKNAPTTTNTKEKSKNASSEVDSSTTPANQPSTPVPVVQTRGWSWRNSRRLGLVVAVVLLSGMVFFLYTQGNLASWTQLDELVITFLVADLSIKLFIAKIGDRKVLRIAVWFGQKDTWMGHWPFTLVGYVLGIFIAGMIGVFALLGRVVSTYNFPTFVIFTALAFLCFGLDFAMYWRD